MIGMRMIDEGGEDDPVWMVPPLPVEARAIPGGTSRAGREDLQVWSFFASVTARGHGKHPLTVETPASDPPDRVLRSEGRRWALELTELTIQDVRADLARVRAAGHRIDQAVRREPQQYVHLLGRNVSLAALTDEDMKMADTAPAVEAVVRALLDDKGYVGEGMDVSTGFPQEWPNQRGFYGKHGGFLVQVHGGGVPNEIRVTASAQTQVRRSEALAALRDRVAAKDCRPNEVLLVTCGLPDQRGFICPLDLFIFQVLQEAAQHTPLLADAPKLRGIALHYWPTGDWIEVWCAAGQEMPWRDN